MYDLVKHLDLSWTKSRGKTSKKNAIGDLFVMTEALNNSEYAAPKKRKVNILSHIKTDLRIIVVLGSKFLL